MNVVSCPNCDAARTGTFCGQCGQNNRDYRRSLPPMLWQLLQEAFDFDGRILRSLKLLLTKPGQLTLEFSANRRADYVSPVRFYLFTSIVFFAVMSITTEPPPNSQVVLQADRGIDVDIVLTESDVQVFAERLTKDQRTNLTQLLSATGTWPEQVARTYIEASNQAHIDKKASEELLVFLDEQVVKVLANPSQALSEFLEQLPIALFFLLPAYAFMLKLIYIRSRRYFVEHLVFAFHLHSFAFIVFTIILFLPDEEDSAWDVMSTLLYIGFTAYYYLSLRRYYAQGRIKTLFKFGVLLNLYSMLLLPAILLVMATTFATY